MQTINQYCNQPPGSFGDFITSKENEAKIIENERKNRIFISKFQQEKDKLIQISKNQSARYDKFNVYLNNKYKTIFYSHFSKKKKFKYTLISELPETVILKEKIKLWADKTYDYWFKKKENQREKLSQLAEKIDLSLLKSDSFVLWKTFNSSMYSTQGFGAEKYTLNHTEEEADKARLSGLEVDIRKTNEVSLGQYGLKNCDFEIWVKIEEIGLDILECKDYPPLRECVKNLLKRGSNPFVIYRFLPPDYMEKERIDWQGNDY